MDCNKCLLCRCGKFEVHGMSCIIEQKHIGEVEICPLDRLAAYVDAEEQGLLVRLPCKVGDTVYRIEVGCCEYREKDACGVYCDGYDYACPDYKADRHLVVGHFSLNDIASLGKTVFLTREEAEAALAKED